MASNQPFILVPLYIYPTETAWQPLLAAATSHPGVFFKVVVNPANGPGPTAFPDANYLTGLRRLAALVNVQILGYVHCSWGRRDASEIEKDVLTYVGWRSWRDPSSDAPVVTAGDAKDNGALTDGKSRGQHEHELSPVLRIDGIFIDEAPPTAALVPYMNALTTFIRTAFSSKESDEANTSSASRPPTTQSESHPPAPSPQCTVIYNPGVVPDAGLFDAADFVVLFESFAGHFAKDAIQAALAPLLAAEQARRNKSIVLMHSCVSAAEQQRLGACVLSQYGIPGQFVTTTPGYTAWCPHWEEYLPGFEGWAAEWARRPGAH